MRSRISWEGGTGRLFKMGVATSPGSNEVARMPLAHSSILMDSLRASTARLVALYAGPVNFDAYRPAHDDTLTMSPSPCARMVGSTACTQ